tara:strand:- start:1432 stop:2070 length:639 start_codon:yes stop_codon:yes gene_type:complete
METKRKLKLMKEVNDKLHAVKVINSNGKINEYIVEFPNAYVRAIIDRQNDLDQLTVSEVYVNDKIEAQVYQDQLIRTPIPATKGNLFLVRGLPGSGKTTIAQHLTEHYVEADMYFIDERGSYHFEPSHLPEAHKWCLNKVKEWMTIWGYDTIAVANTFTEEWEMAEYVKLATSYGYKVHTIVIENRHGNKSIHRVPEPTMQAMEDRFDIKLY